MKWVKASERLPGDDSPKYHFKLEGVKVNGNFYDLNGELEMAFYVSGGGLFEDYTILRKDFDRLEWLDEQSPAHDGWVRVEDGQENGESSICQHDFVLKYMDYEKCAKCGQEKQYAPTVGGAVWVICAANYYDDGIKHEHQPKNISNGFVTCGRRHHNCISTFAQIVGFPYSPEAEKIRNTEVQGFITNTNMFVDRKEALIIATQAKQLIHDVKLDSNIGLTSEDIY